MLTKDMVSLNNSAQIVFLFYKIYDRTIHMKCKTFSQQKSTTKWNYFKDIVC